MTSANAPVSSSCPSDYALDDYELSGRAESHAVAVHAKGCAQCQARLAAYAELKVSLAPFIDQTENAATAAVLANRERTRSALNRVRSLFQLPRPLVLGFAASAAVALVAITFTADHPDTPMRGGETRIKGGVGFTVYGKVNGSVLEVRDGDQVFPGELLRFRVAPPCAGYFMIVSVDSRGAVSAYHPYDGLQAVAVNNQPQLLDGSIELDDTLGAERIIVLFGVEPFSFAAVQKAVASVWPSGGQLEALGALPLSLEQTAITVHKRQRVP